MAIEIEQIKQQAEEQVTKAVVQQQDGWSDAFDSIIQGDFTGFSTVLAIIVFVLLLKPILFLLRYVIGIFIIFMIVKYYAIG